MARDKRKRRRRRKGRDDAIEEVVWADPSPGDEEPEEEPEPEPEEAPEPEPEPEEAPGPERPAREPGGDIIPGPHSERLGPRRAALAERRRRRRRRRVASIVTLVLAGAVVAGVVVFDVFGKDDGGPVSPDPAASGITRDTTTTVLLFGTKESSASSSAIWMNLLFLDREAGRGAVVYIPAHSAVEVPGRGLDAVGNALSSGGVPLLLLSTETLLGVPVDHYVELSNTDARLLFDETGPISVDVPEQVRVEAGPNKARVIFDKGLQRLPASFLAQLLYTVGLDDNDVDLGSRHLAFWDGLFEQFADDPGALGDAVDAAGGALEESDLDPAEVATMLEQLASLDQSDRTITTLPVTPVSVGGSELFQSDTDEIESFVSDTLGVDLAQGDDVRVQILNGNGEPGIGQEVAEKLVPAGFRVVLTGNAPRLDYRKTLVITYDSSDEGTALAEQARELLGVGKVQVSAQPQGIVDLTIVVGKDFLRKR